MSTRALYGNYKFRPPFPHLYQAKNLNILSKITPHKCSVCRTELDRSKVIRRWISLRVATDVLPLLVHACSMACIEALPKAPTGYLSNPHLGGSNLKQPPAEEF